MTNEEAAKMLEARAKCMECNDTKDCDNCNLLYEQGTTGEHIEALSMAIEALRKIPTQMPGISDTTNHIADTDKMIDTDSVSRKALLDELNEMVEQHKDDQFGGQLLHWTGIKAMIECAPSVNPDVIHCRECKHRSHDAIFKHDWCNRTDGAFHVKSDDFCSYAERSDHE